MSISSYWSSYVQINIYGRKLQEMQDDDCGIVQYLKGIGCDNFWIGDIAMYSGNSDSENYPTVPNNACPTPVENTESNTIIDKSLSTTIVNVKNPPCSTPIYSKQWPVLKISPSAISNITSFESDEHTHRINENNHEEREVDNDVRDILEMVLQRLEVTNGNINEQVPEERCESKLQKETESVKFSSNRIFLMRQKSMRNSYSRRCSTRRVSWKNQKSAPLVKQISTDVIPASDGRLSFCGFPSQNNYDHNCQLNIMNLNLTAVPEEACMPIDSCQSARDQTNISVEQRDSERRSINFSHLDDGGVHSSMSGDCSINFDQTIALDSVSPILTRFEKNSIVSPLALNRNPKVESYEQPVSRYKRTEAMNYPFTTSALVSSSIQPPETSSFSKIMDTRTNERGTDASIDLVENNNVEHSQSSLDSFCSAKESLANGSSRDKRGKKKSSLALKEPKIRCEFAGCHKLLSWRKKFGKKRLLDHALGHSDTRIVKCPLCDHYGQTMRQIKGHLNLCHKDDNLKSIGIKNLTKPSEPFEHLWTKCYSTMSSSSYWSSYVQINIYGRKLQEMQDDDCGIVQYLKGIGCDKFWIGDIAMYSGNSDSENYPTVPNNACPTPVENTESNTIIDKSLSTTIVNVKYPPCSTPIYSKQWPVLKISPSAISNITSFESDEHTHRINENNHEEREVDNDVRDILEMVLQRLEVTNGNINEQVLEERCDSKLQKETESVKFSSNRTFLMRQKSMRNSYSRRCSTRRVSWKNQKSAPLVKQISTDVIPASDGRLSFCGFPSQNNYDHNCQLNIMNLNLTAVPEEACMPIDTFQSARDQTNISVEQRDSERRSINFSHLDDGGVYSSLSDDDNEESYETAELPKNGVSFVVPSSPRDMDMNKLYTIKCHFQGCKKSYKWKKRYGKTRLVDHVFTHLTGQEYKCTHCKFTTKNIRNIRRHHKQHHKGILLDGVGIKSMLNSSKQDAYFGDVWNACFRENKIDGLKPFERLDKGRRHRQKRAEAGRDNDDQNFLIR